MNQARRYNYSINGFRGICVLLVFLFHVEEGSHAILHVDAVSDPLGLLHFVKSFKYGVELFFMISGYVIIGSLRNHATVRAFLADRVVRIFPAWIPLHLASFIIGPIMGRDFFAHLDPLHWCLYFLADLFFLAPVLLPVPMASPLAWSLSYEWAFYLLAAAGSVMLSHRRFGRGKGEALIAFAAMFLINLYPRALFFLPGVILALQEDKLRPYARFFQFPSVFLVLFLLTWSATGVDRAEIDTLFITWFGDSRILFALAAFCAATYMFACIVLGSGWSVQKLCTPWPQFLGKISYSFYLLHVVVMFPVKRFAIWCVVPVAGPWCAVFVFAALSFLLSLWVSWLNWKYVEIGLTKVIKRYFGLGKKDRPVGEGMKKAT